jgi:hypothetical protein
MTTYLRLLYPQLLPDLLHSNATGNVCQRTNPLTRERASRRVVAREEPQLR